MAGRRATLASVYQAVVLARYGQVTEEGVMDDDLPGNTSAGGAPFRRNLPARTFRVPLPAAARFSLLAFLVGFAVAAAIGAAMYLFVSFH